MSRAAKKKDTITLSRSRYEALVRRAENAADRAAIAAHEAREEVLGKDAARADSLSLEMVDRLLAGESPVRIWREHRGMTGKALAESAGITPSYLSEIESGKKPGSLDATARIAAALSVQIEDLV